MFDWWTNLNWKIRVTLALFVLALATLPLLLPDLGMRSIKAVAGLYAFGFIMLVTAFPSRGEKNEWGDW